MVRPEIIRRRLQKLDTFIEYLDRAQAYSFERARDAPDLFQKHGRIGEEARDTWQSMIGFRNVLVHEYVDIERRRVYDTLQYHLDDIRQLSHAFDRFLE